MSILEHIEKCLRAKNDFAPQDEKGAPQNPFSPSAFFNAFSLFQCLVILFHQFLFKCVYNNRGDHAGNITAEQG